MVSLGWSDWQVRVDFLREVTIVSGRMTTGPKRPASSNPPAGHGFDAKRASVADLALELLDEQVQARIVHYRSDLETNPELDSVTEEVVRQVRQVQERAAARRREPISPATLTASLAKHLTTVLSKAFRPEPSFLVETRLRRVHRKLARMFLEAQVRAPSSPGETGISSGEQAVFYALERHRHAIVQELQQFDYDDPSVLARAMEVWDRVGRDLKDTFVGKNSAELKKIIVAFQAVLLEFYCGELPRDIERFAQDVVAGAVDEEAASSFDYKITLEGFPRFRQSFERQLMVRLVPFAQTRVMDRLDATAQRKSDRDVQRFATGPAVFSMIVGEYAVGCYELLYQEGFLDLPEDFKKMSVKEEGRRG